MNHLEWTSVNPSKDPKMIVCQVVQQNETSEESLKMLHPACPRSRGGCERQTQDI